MSEDIARKSVRLALQSPSKNLVFEFQGGEPLLNMQAIMAVVDELKRTAHTKTVELRCVTNLTLLTNNILDYLINNNIAICVSLDGPEEIHNTNRPHKTGGNSYQLTQRWLPVLRNRLPNSDTFSAIPTITRSSLANYANIIDTYIENGFQNIYLRPLSPFGRARRTWNEIGYSADEFVEFYRTALKYIININSKGISINESFATMMLSQLFTDRTFNFMELRSPCGAGIGQLAYNWNGEVYTCDEGRMVAVGGDHSFQVGTVDDSYEKCMQSPALLATCSASCMEGHPNCESCVFMPFCGRCPVYESIEYGTICANLTHDYRCKVLKGLFTTIFDLLTHGTEEQIHVLKSWVL
jgi:His-Xaa-Ser system radical SAM maturase HxsB